MPSDAAQLGVGSLGVLAASLLAVTAASQVALPADQGGIQGAAEDLAEQFLQVGTDAADRWTQPVEVLQAYGRILAPGGERLDALNLSVRAPASAGDVPLADIVLRLADGARDRWLAHGGTPGFAVTSVRDADGSLGRAAPVLNEGDLAVLDLDLRPGAADFELPVRAKFTLEVLPEKGAPARLPLQVPPSFGQDRVFTLK